MGDIERCSRCILPTSLPSVNLDADGVCNYCHEYDESFANWEKIKKQKKVEFENVLEQAKQLKRPYDCLIPLSGGKDSIYTLYLCSKVYGLKCLCVTSNTGFMSGRAITNIKNALEATDLDHIFFNFNHKKIVKLFKFYIKKSGEFCPACMRCIGLSIEKAAKMYNIPLVIKGSGRRIQYVSQIPELATKSTANVFRNVVKDGALEKEFSHLFTDQKTLELDKKLGAPIYLLEKFRKRLTKDIPMHVSLYDYIYIPRKEIYPIIKKEMGWEKFGETYEHMDCMLHEIPFYIQTLKFPQLTIDTLYNCSMIRQGLMTRDEALKIDEEKLSHPEIPGGLKYFLKEINMSYDDFIGYTKVVGKAQQFYTKKKQSVVGTT